MTLIKSISGIRGTIGGVCGENLTPPDVVNMSTAYGMVMMNQSERDTPRVVIGRDARLSGETIQHLVSATLQNLGIDIIDLGLSTTPTVEMAVVSHEAIGGIIITASHNPQQWNALKFLNEKGEFISSELGRQIVELAEAKEFDFVGPKKIGKRLPDEQALENHLEAILKLPLVDVEAISQRQFRVAVDAVNSSGGIAVPQLLNKLGVTQIKCVYCEPTGYFPHNPEPLPENLTQIASEVANGQFDLGVVVDPDVDRLCFVDEMGNHFGEEYTLVAVADYILSHHAGNSVSNLSSSRALRDITEKHGGEYFASAVGEVNVVEKMKETHAVIGGEGNGGVIVPELHYGRDALVGIALFLSHLATSGKSASKLKSELPHYHISKNKIELNDSIDLDEVMNAIQQKYHQEEINTADGVRIDFSEEWVHLRKSNTEPIIRIYAESESESTANHLANKIIMDIKEIIDNGGSQ